MKIFIEVVTILLVILLGGVHATPLPPPPRPQGRRLHNRLRLENHQDRIASEAVRVKSTRKYPV